MERLQVPEKSIDHYLTLVTRVTPLNESLSVIILGSFFLVIIINALLMNEKILFLQTNLTMKFSSSPSISS